MSRTIANVVTEKSRRLLEPGESVSRVYLAQGGINPWSLIAFSVVGLVLVRGLSGAMGQPGGFGALGGLVGGFVGWLIATMLTTRRVILKTDRSVVLLACGKFTAKKPVKVVTRLPKGTKVGPLSGTWAPLESGGEKLWIHKMFHDNMPELTTKLG